MGLVALRAISEGALVLGIKGLSLKAGTPVSVEGDPYLVTACDVESVTLKRA